MRRFHAFGGLCVVAGWLVAAGGIQAAELGSDSGVSGLAVLADLEPAAVTPARTGGSAIAMGASVRQSVPVKDRAASYAKSDSFANLRVAVPLLVADLEPVQAVSSVRPMSGRSVGAPPSGSWIRAVGGYENTFGQR